MKKQKGSFSTIIVSIIASALVLATLYLLLATMSNTALLKAKDFLIEQDYTNAMKYFLKADKLTLRPNLEIKRGLAESLIATGDRESALKNYEKLIELDPSNMEDRYILGELYIDGKNYKKAELQISALRDMNTEKATKYAEKLSSQIQTEMVKGFLKDFIDKVIPGFKKSPSHEEEEYVPSK